MKLQVKDKRACRQKGDWDNLQAALLEGVFQNSGHSRKLAEIDPYELYAISLDTHPTAHHQFPQPFHQSWRSNGSWKSQLQKPYSWPEATTKLTELISIRPDWQWSMYVMQLWMEERREGSCIDQHIYIASRSVHSRRKADWLNKLPNRMLPCYDKKMFCPNESQLRSLDRRHLQAAEQKARSRILSRCLLAIWLSEAGLGSSLAKLLYITLTPPIWSISTAKQY